MRQVKLFKSVEAEVSALESQINDWIRESGVNVVRIQGNIAPQSESASGGSSKSMTRYAPSDILIIVEYETA
ncbi:MAG: hypothetical protein ACF8TS_06090 [Maioricimonas sp. JB049]